ncbi:permease [Pseudomonas syringae group sp. 243L2]|uniref:permease n=1 Tax=Pseudomonas syringae group sp. 243L2 TaxID=3079593 RepID=UPI00290627B9|nr:permease [Pseudomonas syringae group sp. 243L2]MDU8631742.1 permease [Pseudomonas syringae group sp. 243L2]
MTQQENNPTLPQGGDVLSWKIKTLARSPREMMITQSIFIAVYLTGCTLYMWGGWIMFSDSLYSLVGTLLAFAGILAYFIGLLIRQKTIYTYTLKTDGATVEYYLHYPDFASALFKGIAIFVILAFVLVAPLTGSLLFLIGPVAMAFITAIKLLNWENPVHYRQTAPWHLHEFVTVDHKRLMVIIHCEDITSGFAARFPSKALMDKYLAFLRKALPANAQYIEKATDWHQG